MDVDQVALVETMAKAIALGRRIAHPAAMLDLPPLE
jgi:hypothetical protein